MNGACRSLAYIRAEQPAIIDPYQASSVFVPKTPPSHQFHNHHTSPKSGAGLAVRGCARSSTAAESRPVQI